MLTLTKENLQEWKAELDSEFTRQHGITDYSKTQTDEYWLEEYTDYPVQEAIDDETQYWED